jgi:uncharacterized membrane protein
LVYEIFAFQMKVETLRSAPLFGSLDHEAARELCDLLTVRDCQSGTVLFCSGDSGDAMYFVETGRVRISVKDADGSNVTLAEFRNGDFFGEMAVLDGQARSADAHVVENTRLAILSRQDFHKFVRSKPDVALEMLGAITHRLRRTDELLRHRVSRNANEEEKSRLTLADRAADLIAEFGGSWKFIGAAAVFLILWVALNTWLLFDKGFDPFPYVLLNLVLGMITSLQAPIIMMSQNRQVEKDRLRADLDYQVNLKNELLLSEILRRLDTLENDRLPKLFKDFKGSRTE